MENQKSQISLYYDQIKFSQLNLVVMWSFLNIPSNPNVLTQTISSFQGQPLPGLTEDECVQRFQDAFRDFEREYVNSVVYNGKEPKVNVLHVDGKPSAIIVS